MNDIEFIYNQVHQITQNIDYAYAFNGESLVFSPKPLLYPAPNHEITNSKSKCIFLCIIKEQIILPLLLGNSQSSSDDISQQSSDSDEQDPSNAKKIDIFTSALAITNDSSNVIIGRSDGSLAILNLKPLLDSHLENNANNQKEKGCNHQVELSSNNYTNYKYIHKNEITDMAFLKGNKRVIIGDKTGMVTLLSFVNSFTCELVVQTTIINLKMPYLLFEVYPEDNIFAFASLRGFSVLKAGRRIEVLLCNEEDILNSDICCSIDNITEANSESSESTDNENSKKDENISKNRILVCKNRSIFVYDIEISENRKIDQWTIELPEDKNNQTPNPIIRCFIINHFFFLLLFKDGSAMIIRDKSGEAVSKITDLPTCSDPSRIQLNHNNLTYFMKSDIVQKTIDLPTE